MIGAAVAALCEAAKTEQDLAALDSALDVVPDLAESMGYHLESQPVTGVRLQAMVDYLLQHPGSRLERPLLSTIATAQASEADPMLAKLDRTRHDVHSEIVKLRNERNAYLRKLAAARRLAKASRRKKTTD